MKLVVKVLVEILYHPCITKMTSRGSEPDFWEEQYHDIYRNWQLYQERIEKDLDLLEQNYRKAEEKSKEEIEKCKTLQACMMKLGEEMKILQKGEQSYMKERAGLISCISQLEKTISHNTGQTKKKDEENKRVKESFRESLQRSRDALSEKTDVVCKLEETVARLREENQELKDTLSDIKNRVECKDVKVLNSYDELFARYVSSFSHDEESIRHRFQDKTTQGSNCAFQVLLQTCHGDVTKEVKHMQCLIPTAQSMVDAILYHKIEIRACMYVRTIQLRYSGLFDGATDAQAKAKDLTKYKIKFEQVDLNNARANFVVALLGAMQNLPNSRTSSQKESVLENVKFVKNMEQEEKWEEDMGNVAKKQKLDNAMNKAFGFD